MSGLDGSLLFYAGQPAGLSLHANNVSGPI